MSSGGELTKSWQIINWCREGWTGQKREQRWIFYISIWRIRISFHEKWRLNWQVFNEIKIKNYLGESEAWACCTQLWTTQPLRYLCCPTQNVSTCLDLSPTWQDPGYWAGSADVSFFISRPQISRGQVPPSPTNGQMPPPHAAASTSLTNSCHARNPRALPQTEALSQVSNFKEMQTHYTTPKCFILSSLPSKVDSPPRSC